MVWSGRRLHTAAVAAAVMIIVVGAASCGGGGPSRDDFQEAANAICADSNEEAADLDEPTALEDAVDYADEAREILNDRILTLDDDEQVEVPDDDESDFEDYLDALVEERDAMIELSEADPEGDDLESLIEEVERLEEDSTEIADDLGLDDCSDAEEGVTVALALEAQPEPEPVPNPDPVDPDPEPEPEDNDLGSDPIAAIQALGLPDGFTYTGETQDVTDDSGTLSMLVPVEWSDVSGAPADDGSLTVVASPDLEEYQSGFTTPGALFVGTAAAVDLDALLDQFSPPPCTPIGQGDYSDPAYTGRFQLTVDCAGTPTAVLVISASAIDGTHNVVVQIAITSVQDIDPAAGVLDTFVADSERFSD